MICFHGGDFWVNKNVVNLNNLTIYIAMSFWKYNKIPGLACIQRLIKDKTSFICGSN